MRENIRGRENDSRNQLDPLTLPPRSLGSGSPTSTSWSSTLTFEKISSVLAPNTLVKTFCWSITLLSGAVGLEALGRAPWQSSKESTPISTLVDHLANRKLPELARKYLGRQRTEVQTVVIDVPAPVPETPNREVLQHSFDVIARILRERAGSKVPDIDLTSPAAAAQTIGNFKDAIAEMPPYLEERFLLWDAMKPPRKDPESAAVAQRFKETVEAIAAKKPVPPPLEPLTWMSKVELPDPVSNAPFSKASANGQYYELRDEVIPALNSYLAPLDVVLRINRIPVPEKRLDNARAAMATLFEYSDALRKLDRNHPQLAAVRRIGDGLGRSTLTTQTIKELLEEHKIAKQREAEFQEVSTQLLPLLNSFLDTVGQGLRATGQRVPSRDFSSIPSTIETLIRFEASLSEVAPRSRQVDMLRSLADGLWVSPKTQVAGLRALLDVSGKPSEKDERGPAKTKDLPEPPVPTGDLPEPPVPTGDLPEPPVPRRAPPKSAPLRK